MDYYYYYKFYWKATAAVQMKCAGVYLSFIGIKTFYIMQCSAGCAATATHDFFPHPFNFISDSRFFFSLFIILFYCTFCGRWILFLLLYYLIKTVERCVTNTITHIHLYSTCVYQRFVCALCTNALRLPCTSTRQISFYLSTKEWKLKWKRVFTGEKV